VFPIRDDNPHFTVPYVTYAIVVLNVLSWVFLQGLGMEPQLSSSVCNFGLIPAELLQTVSGQERVQVGPQLYCTLDDSPGWLTVFSSMFMHGSWLHIIANMWFLWIFGNNVEDAMGHVRFAIFYLLSGLLAAGLQIAANPGSVIPMVGASGAIGGVMGAYIVFYPRVNVHLLVWLGFFVTTLAVPAVLMLGYWFLLQLLSGFASIGAEGGVAFWAHVGGFAGGALLSLLFRDKERLEKHPYAGWREPPSRSWQRVERRR
jgi:membrane associated rhomboid family serine protease